jgi:hypothetical protein
MTALVKHDAFSFKHQALKVGLLNDHAAGRNSSPGIDNAMPRDVSLVVRRRVHRPPDEPRTVAFLEQVCDLPVGHHAPSRDSQHQAVNFLESLFEARDAETGRRGDAGTLCFAASPGLRVSASSFRRCFTHAD